jgi:L-rhamnose mutarotase
LKNYSIFIDEPATPFTEKSINILLKWVEENERCKEHSKVIDKVTNPITNKPNWIS